MTMPSNRIVLHRTLLFPLAAAGLSLFSMASAQAQIILTPKAPGYTSYICSNGDNPFVSDTDFANYAASAFITNGVSHVKDADFILDTCYGGGFLSTLTTTLSSSVDWVGESGSQYNQCALGGDNGGTLNVPLDVSMTNDFNLNGANSTTPLLTSLVYARNNDTEGPNGTSAENPQITYANGGDKAAFNDVTNTPASGNTASLNAITSSASPNGGAVAGQHYAILWAGIVDPAKPAEYLGFRRDIDMLYAQMQNSWGAANSHIYVLYGNGVDDGHGTTLASLYGGPNNPNNVIMQATGDNLKAAYAAIGGKITSNDQFLFLSTDHGSSDMPVVGDPIVLMADSTGQPPVMDDTTFQENASSEADIQQNPGTMGTFTVNYNAAGAAMGQVGFVLDGTNFLLDPTKTTETFSILDGSIASSDSLNFFNSSPDSVSISSAFFNDGALTKIDPNAAPVPEVSTSMSLGLLFALGLGGIAVVRKRKTSAA